MTDQQSLPFGQQFNAGDRVWWLNGLKYLTVTYRNGDKIRPEPMLEVEILEVTQDEHGHEDFWINAPGYDHPIRTVRRWFSTDPKVPCEAVLQAYGVFL